jgi:hypothetical protein
VSNPERPAAASPPWWALLPPAQTGVSCGGRTHQLRWSEGTLIALDHPDAEGERVLAALGGDRCECIDLVESWVPTAMTSRSWPSGPVRPPTS